MFRVPLIIGTIYNIIAEAKQKLTLSKRRNIPGKRRACSRASEA